MAITSPVEIVTGAARVYLAPTGTAFPSPGEIPGAPWVDLGETMDGVTLTPEGDVEEIRLDQISGPAKAVRPEEGFTIQAKFAQGTLERLANFLGQSVASGSGTKSVLLGRGQAVQEIALMVRGASPYVAGGTCQWQFPRAYVKEIGDITYTKDEPLTFEVTFGVLWDFSASPGEEMGKVVAATA